MLERLRAVLAELRRLGAVVCDESVLGELDEPTLEALLVHESRRLALLLRETAAPGPRPWRCWRPEEVCR